MAKGRRSMRWKERKNEVGIYIIWTHSLSFLFFSSPLFFSSSFFSGTAGIRTYTTSEKTTRQRWKRRRRKRRGKRRRRRQWQDETSSSSSSYFWFLSRSLFSFSFSFSSPPSSSLLLSSFFFSGRPTDRPTDPPRRQLRQPGQCQPRPGGGGEDQERKKKRLLLSVCTYYVLLLQLLYFCRCCWIWSELVVLFLPRREINWFLAADANANVRWCSVKKEEGSISIQQASYPATSLIMLFFCRRHRRNMLRSVDRLDGHDTSKRSKAVFVHSWIGRKIEAIHKKRFHPLPTFNGRLSVSPNLIELEKICSLSFI